MLRTYIKNVLSGVIENRFCTDPYIMSPVDTGISITVLDKSESIDIYTVQFSWA